MLMTMNAVRWNTYLLIIQEELEKLTKILQKKLDFADVQFLFKTKDIQKIKNERTCTGITVFGYENKEKYPTYMSKILSKTMLIYYW